ACYAITNRRLLLHGGLGGQTMYSRSGASAVSGTSGVLNLSGEPVMSYTGFELTRIQRLELKRFPGAGELCFGRHTVAQAAGGCLWARGDLHKVEKMLRETLVDPVIDKLLRGELLSQEEKGKGVKGPGKDEGQVIAPDANIKEYVSNRDSGGASASLGKIPADLRKTIDEELTEGEEVLWAAKPERGPEGRGLLGAVTGAAVNKEPKYTLFAITNRRVILWAEKGTRVGKQSSWGGERRGPLSYY